MKKSVLFVLLLISLSTNAQIVIVDPNVPRSQNTSEKLVSYIFPEDENRNIKFSGIVNCGISADTIMGLAKQCVYDIAKRYNAKCDLELEGMTKIGFHVKMPVGKEFFVITYPYAPRDLMERPLSFISFDVTIETHEGKYRYVMDNFITQRIPIHGAGISEGQSNFVHWQRVYSLTKETPRRGKKKKEYEMMIEKEKSTYQAEYNAVQKVIADLESFTAKTF